MANIEIFLSIDETQTSFLSIPRSDIERLVILPFQWIRYVMFAICGARGDLSTTPNGPAVDYENPEIANDQTYYYRPSGRCAFVDYEGLNDRITTTDGTARRHDFREDVVRRDGPACVITQVEESYCDASHLIPHSKGGDEYIEKVMQLRSPGDGSAPRIDMTENGIFLNKTVHSMLGKGAVALIKTPNYELKPEHLKRFRQGDERDVYITLQWIKKPKDFDARKLNVFQISQNAGIDLPPSIAHDALQNVDALFQGEGVPLPSSIILDYIYGIAAYKAWSSNRSDGFNKIEAYRKEHYANIPPPSSAPPDDIDDTDVTPGPDDCNDAEYKPPSRKRPRTKSGLEETMDELNMFLMYLHGITPEMAAERRQKEIEQEEQVAQEAGRRKFVVTVSHVRFPLSTTATTRQRQRQGWDEESGIRGHGLETRQYTTTHPLRQRQRLGQRPTANPGRRRAALRRINLKLQKPHSFLQFLGRDEKMSIVFDGNAFPCL